MRFHIGCSFRPKNLLKYLFPFLLGILAMLGIDSVSADTFSTNYDTYFNVEYSQDLIDTALNRVVPGVNKTTQELIDYALSSINSNNPIAYVIYLSNFGTTSEQLSFVEFTSSSCPNTEIIQNVYGRKFPNNTFSDFNFSINDRYNPNCRFNVDSFWINDSDESSHNAQVYTYLSTHMQGQGSFVSQSVTRYQTLRNTTFTNNDSFNIYNYPVLYDTNTTIVNKLEFIPSNGVSTANFFFKSLTLNGVEVPNNTQFPSYLQLQQMQGELNQVSSSLPYNYFTLNKSQISSFSAKLTYTPLINATTYVDLVGGGNTYFFGRVNHNDSYYTYEDIICTLSRTANIGSDNKVSVNYSNLSCSSDLTNYDNIYMFESFSYAYDEDNLYSHQIFNVGLTSNVLSYSSTDFKGYIYEPLTLQNGFKLLISSTFQNKIWFATTNNYLSYNKLSTDDITYINNTISGVQIGYEHIKNGGRLPLYTSLSYGTYDDSMIFLYDNYTMHESMTTDLKLFIDSPTYVMVSFPVVINGQDTFSYYNTEGTITSDTGIATNYGNVGGNYNNGAITGDDYFLSVVNNFFDEIDHDLVDFHQLLQTIFNNIPSFIKLFIVVSYTLFMLLFIFKEMKK